MNGGRRNEDAAMRMADEWMLAWRGWRAKPASDRHRHRRRAQDRVRACARVGRMQAAGVGAHSSSTSLGTSVVGRTSVDAWTVAFFSGRGVRRRPVEALPGWMRSPAGQGSQVGITRSVGSVLVLRSDPCTQIDGRHGSREAVWSPFQLPSSPASGGKIKIN
jgi:hypothetical protein